MTPLGPDFVPEADRLDFPEILARRHGAEFEGVRLAAGTNYAPGLVLGRITASGLYAAYNNAAGDGTEVAVGILAERVDATGAVNKFGRLVKRGDFYTSKLTGLDAAAEADLGARHVIGADGVDILHVP